MLRDKPRARLSPVRVESGVVVGAVVAAATGCEPSNCRDPGLEEGEQVRVTIVAQRETSDLPSGEVCGDLPPLAPGYAFVLTGGETFPLEEPWYCDGRAARPDLPDFAQGMFTECQSSDNTLGLTCTGEERDGCTPWIGFSVRPIPSGWDSAGDAAMWMRWYEACVGAESCIIWYDARVERIGMAAD